MWNWAAQTAFRNWASREDGLRARVECARGRELWVGTLGTLRTIETLGILRTLGTEGTDARTGDAKGRLPQE